MQLNLFYSWWQDDAERSLCTMQQAIGAYCSTFPGRLLPLLVELIQDDMDARDEPTERKD